MGVQRRPRNSILQSLSSQDFNSIWAELKPVELTRGTVLFEPHVIAPRIYFPVDSVISFMGDTGEGGTIEVWAVGSEGLAGVAGLLGKAKPFRGVVQVGGNAVMANSSVFRRFQKCLSFHGALIRYCHHLLVEISYLGICNNSHPIEQRFSRWL